MMATFRIHTADGGKHDVDAGTADQARKLIASKMPGIIIRKIKLVREAA